MKKRVILLCAVLCLALAFSGCGKKEESKEALSGVNVTVCEVKNGDIEEKTSYTGTIKASEGASVSAMVSGTIKSVNVDIGDYVTKGTVLMTIDSTQYSLAYNQALAAYNSAVASYNSATGGSAEQNKLNVNQALSNAESAYNTALDNYNRHKALYDIGAVSKVALDSSKTSLDNAEVALNTAKSTATLNDNVVIPQTEAGAKAGVGQAKAALDMAASNLSYCTVVAPVSGYVTVNNAQKGRMASPGVELFAVEDTSLFDVEINVTEAVIPYISESTKAYVSVKSAALTDLEATVSAASNAKNAQSGMYLVKVTLPNDEGKIKLGMLADVTLITDGADDVLVIDANAIMSDSKGSFVYVAKDGKAIRRDIEVGVADAKSAQVISGLKKGEKVIVDGKDFISEKNNEIRIVD